jgi:hypothetical protein
MPMKTGRRLIGFISFLILSMGMLAPTAAQENSGPLSLTIDAAFEGNYRADQWTPVLARIENTGPDLEGRLVIRPETSINAVNNTYSLPLSMPQGSRKTAFLYITLTGLTDQIRLEYIRDDGVVIGFVDTPIRLARPRDRLHVVVTQSVAGSVDLSGVHDAGYNGVQANWRIENIPEQVQGLSSVNTLFFSDVDTSLLTTLQREAIRDWVIGGGQLIVTGGAAWQATSAGLSDLLPFTAEGSLTLPAASALGDWLRQGTDELAAEGLVAAGSVKPNAQVLVQQDDRPLLIRGSLGAGTVDYLTLDPGTAPLRGWSALPDLWLTLASTVDAQPPWNAGLGSDWSGIQTAVNVLPGVNLLPDVLPLCGFLAAYMLLIGPINYLVLNRLNRRELAWVTMPVLILIFSVLAWVVGFNLRGNEVTVSRLAVIESWPDTDRARVQQVVGLLSPRRARYDLTVGDGTFLRPIPRLEQPGLLGTAADSNTEINQTDQFQAWDFPVDASFIAPFAASTMTSPPDVTGSVTLFSEGSDGQQIMRGSVSNGLDVPLENPVVLVRGVAYGLTARLEPGQVWSFEVTLAGADYPSPAPIAFAPGEFASVFNRSFAFYNSSRSRTVNDIFGLTADERRFGRIEPADPNSEESYRRLQFVSALAQDASDIFTSRGNHAYLAAWSSQAPLAVSLTGSVGRSIDTTLYLVKLAVEVEKPTERTLITADQFTWTVIERSSLADLVPVGLRMQAGDSVAFAFTPLPESVLTTVDELAILLDRNGNAVRSVPVQLWNWARDRWDVLQVTGGRRFVVPRPADYLGAQNTVRLRLNADDIGSFSTIQDVAVEQRGTY